MIIYIDNGINNLVNSCVWNESKNPLAPLNFMGVFLSGLISCMMCTSTWVGFVMSFVWSPFNNVLEVHQAVSVFFDGMLASGGVWFINTIVEWFEETKGNNG